MKKHIFLLLALAGFMLSSCTSTYFYSTLNTKNSDIEKVENGDFLFENDSLWIAYCFKGEDAPILITVYNKLDVPMYIDWQRSALILNETAYSYGEGQSTFAANIYAYNDFSSTAEGSINGPKHTTFLPPKTRASHSSLRLTARFDEIENKNYTKGRLVTSNDEVEQMGKISYDNENTPLQFSSYITVAIGSDSKDVKSYKSTFYVTNLIKTKVKPERLPSSLADRGDTFYQHIRPNNTGWKIAAATAIVAGSVAVDVMVHNNYYDYDHHHRP